jgi:hypothetical protein
MSFARFIRFYPVAPTPRRILASPDGVELTSGVGFASYADANPTPDANPTQKESSRQAAAVPAAVVTTARGRVRTEVVQVPHAAPCRPAGLAGVEACSGVNLAG